MLVVHRMELDHAHAAMIAETINTEGGGRVLVRRVDTNLVIAWVDPALASPDQVVAALAEGEVKYLQYLQHLIFTIYTIYTIYPGAGAGADLHQGPVPPRLPLRRDARHGAGRPGQGGRRHQEHPAVKQWNLTMEVLFSFEVIFFFVVLFFWSRPYLVTC